MNDKLGVKGNGLRKKLPLYPVCCIVIGNILIFGGYYYLRLYKLPTFKFIRRIKMKYTVNKLLQISENRILAC